jgi:hypothetical protein
MPKKLHIVCLDVPHPADHGGTFDLFYKIVALHKSGTEIILHCFEYGKGEQEELKEYCTQVYYYKRTIGLKGFSFSLPYIVSSRINKPLFKNLQEDNLPILLEGTHTTYLAYKNLFPDRTVLFRLHNIERIYYHHLSQAENNIFRKIYYGVEARLLKNYEAKAMRNASFILPVSRKDAIKVSLQPQPQLVNYLPVFLPFQEVNIIEGSGSYCLYHGNLSVAENIKAVYWLAGNIDVSLFPLVVAGKNPPSTLTKFLQEKNITLVANPSNEKLLELIQHAHINIILSFNDTGIKLKLLNALFHGRHCIANEAAIPDEEFKNYCDVFLPHEINKTISTLLNKPFTELEIDSRRKFLLGQFNNEMNAAKLNALL